ncbi:MAG TPA: hypothetical protein VGO58_09315, partial [Chitinophagaceae bacterium]|nr:hypothetical protein [Chitinophagaceae bacterium]
IGLNPIRVTNKALSVVLRFFFGMNRPSQVGIAAGGTRSLSQPHKQPGQLPGETKLLYDIRFLCSPVPLRKQNHAFFSL